MFPKSVSWQLWIPFYKGFDHFIYFLNPKQMNLIIYMIAENAYSTYNPYFGALIIYKKYF